MILCNNSIELMRKKEAEIIRSAKCRFFFTMCDNRIIKSTFFSQIEFQQSILLREITLKGEQPFNCSTTCVTISKIYFTLPNLILPWQWINKKITSSSIPPEKVINHCRYLELNLEKWYTLNYFTFLFDDWDKLFFLECEEQVDFRPQNNLFYNISSFQVCGFQFFYPFYTVYVYFIPTGSGTCGCPDQNGFENLFFFVWLKNQPTTVMINDFFQAHTTYGLIR